MALTLDLFNLICTVPQADMLDVTGASPTEIREHNLDAFRTEWGALMDNEPNVSYPWPFEWTQPVTLGPVTYAPLLRVVNGWTVKYSPGTYNVNITGGNSNMSDVLIKNTVGVNTANSAGLQDSKSLQAASFGGHVTVDVINGVIGTTYPRGTQETPVNNLTDAHNIAEAQGISRFLISNDMTFDSISMTGGYVFYAEKNDVTVTLNAGIDITNASFQDLTVTGTLDGNNRFTGCEVFDVVSLNGTLIDCGLSGTLTLSGGLTTSLVSCHSDVAGVGVGEHADIDMGGSGNSLIVRAYSGGIGIKNYAGSGDISIDMDSGRVVVESTVTAGTVSVRGVAVVADDSTGTATVVDSTLTNETVTTRKLVGNRRETNPTTGVQTVWEDDDVTVFRQGSLWENVAGTTPYTGNGADRADRMA